MAKRSRVSDVDFVRTYASSDSIGEVATKLGVSPASIATRASSLRKKGVHLPKFSRGRKQTDVAALNQLLASMGVDPDQDQDQDELVPVRPIQRPAGAGTGKRGRPRKNA